MLVGTGAGAPNTHDQWQASHFLKCEKGLVTTPTEPTFRLKPKPIPFLSIFEFSVMVEFPIMGIWLD